MLKKGKPEVVMVCSPGFYSCVVLVVKVMVIGDLSSTSHHRTVSFS